MQLSRARGYVPSYGQFAALVKVKHKAVLQPLAIIEAVIAAARDSRAKGSVARVVLRCFGAPMVTIDHEPCTFATQHALQACVSLALAPDHQLDLEELGSRLWPDAPLSRLQGRLSTMVWQLRTGLGPEGWRIGRPRGRLRLEMDGVAVDVLEVRASALRLAVLSGDERNVDQVAATIEALSVPVLAPWTHHQWVRDEQDRNDQLRGVLDRGETL
jgi:DNA-binding SARP family transcriptional activator